MIHHKILILTIIGIFLIISNKMTMCAEEFQVYRMQQFDTQGAQFGSRATMINMEAKTINSNSLTRKCVLIKLSDLTLEQFRNLISQHVSAIIIILPSKYSESDRESLKTVENTLLKEAIKIPVYFTLETEDILKYYDYVDNEKSGKSDSALNSLRDSIFMNGFQFVVNTQQSSILQDFQPTNIQGRLMGQGNDQKPLRNIIITAPYDALGMATSLSYGCDSNGSGVVALLELSRILSYLYANMKTVPIYNIVFLLSSAGKFNYYGTKKWLEEQTETSESFGKIDIEDTAFAICLDSLANGNGINMHVSRPPKDNHPSSDFLKKLEEVSTKHGVKFEMIHKKINLANELMAWEHERFSLNKIPGFTLSHYGSHKDINRSTMTDTRDSVDSAKLIRNIKVIAETLGRFIYNTSDNLEIFNNDLDISEPFLNSWLDHICSIPRTTSLISNTHPLISAFQSHFSTYLKDTLKLTYKINSKEPEFSFYNEEQCNLVISKVKPAVFDLFLSLMIIMYLGCVYLFVAVSIISPIKPS